MDDFENLDPLMFSKRTKVLGVDGDFTKCFAKPSSTFFLTKATPTPSLPSTRDSFGIPSTKQPPSTKSRTILQPKSPARLSLKSVVPPSLTVPAGRSPTRGSKRMGILSRRRTQRIDALSSFGSGATVPFSLDAALRGTIPSYSGSLQGGSGRQDASLVVPDAKSSWTFEIHEDTPEQEMTNLLQHSTCTLDISSDEESERRARRDRAEGRDKENIPPADDISQTSARSTRAADMDDMVVEKERGFLAEMNAADFYADGCDKSSIIIIPGDEEDSEAVIDETGENPARLAEPEIQPLADDDESDLPAHQGNFDDVDAAKVEEIMGKDEWVAPPPQPIEGAGESFDVWESGSAKDEAEPPASHN